MPITTPDGGHADRTRRLLKILGIAATVPATAFGAYTIMSHVLFGRSNVGTASEIYNRFTSDKDAMSNAVEWDNAILKAADENEKRYDMPLLASLRVTVDNTEIAGMQTFLINKRAINDRAVIYLHGRTYVDQPSTYHWMFLDKVARKTRAEIIMPLYPLAPVHTQADAYKKLEELYRGCVDKYGAGSITIMGDTSGGGLAAGFCQHLAETDLEQPHHLILISPWVDITLNNPQIASIEPIDPMFSVSGLRKAGELWSRGIEAADPRVSPINGDIHMLRNVTTFVGTREVFYPDARLFHERVAQAGIHAELVEGRGLNNDYPLYPIPEATRAIDKIADIISED